MSSAEKDHEKLQESLDLLHTYGNDPEACRKLSQKQLNQVVGMKLITFGLEPSAEDAQAVTALYRMYSEEASLNLRRKLLTTTTDFVEQNAGNGISALWVFLSVDPDISIRSEASLAFSVLHPQTEDDEPFIGAKKILRYLKKQAEQKQDVAAPFHGLLNLGDSRLVEDLKIAFRNFDQSDKIETTKYPMNAVTHALVDFYLCQLEEGCNDELFGSICGHLARLPKLAVEAGTGVLDIERAFPAYSSEEAIKVVNQWTVKDYLKLIRPRLEQIIESESEPKVIPRLIEIWEDVASNEND